MTVDNSHARSSMRSKYEASCMSHFHPLSPVSFHFLPFCCFQFECVIKCGSECVSLQWFSSVWTVHIGEGCLSLLIISVCSCWPFFFFGCNRSSPVVDLHFLLLFRESFCSSLHFFSFRVVLFSTLLNSLDSVPFFCSALCFSLGFSCSSERILFLIWFVCVLSASFWGALS